MAQPCEWNKWKVMAQDKIELQMYRTNRHRMLMQRLQKEFAGREIQAPKTRKKKTWKTCFLESITFTVMFWVHQIFLYGLIKNAQYVNFDVTTHHLHQILLHPCSHTLHHLVSIALQWHHQSKTETVIHLDSIPSVEFSVYGLGKCAGWRRTLCPTATEQKQASNIREGNDTP